MGNCESIRPTKPDGVFCQHFFSGLHNSGEQKFRFRALSHSFQCHGSCRIQVGVVASRLLNFLEVNQCGFKILQFEVCESPIEVSRMKFRVMLDGCCIVLDRLLFLADLAQ